MTTPSDTTGGILAFDISEFSRLAADSTTISQLTSEDFQQVADALYIIRSSMSQFEPKVIDNLDQYPQLKANKCNFSYNDNESMMTAKGVRTFRIQGRE
ncbi:unnamed protein product [Adineta steineri]|uniref:Uncharacterized protein n=1 Tax=Adineta steineri TaxID=433720 RepID=A0A814VJT4_9BILA|nr:unnamed protein product [Adineta steineri]CAF1436339.1 unnamed protein product [Adineta steineri]